MPKPAGLLVTLALVACGTPGASGAEETAAPDPLRAWVVSETVRLAPEAGAPGDDAERERADLAEIAAEAEAGRALHAASRLPSIRLRVEARRDAASRKATVTDLDALAADAAALAADFERAEARMATALPARPAAVRALADAAWVHGRAYRGAAVAYARVTSLDAGLFYLGAARSLLGAAADLAALPVPPPAAGGAQAPGATVLDAELADLDERTIAAYRAPGAEVERHADFIALDAEIKEARDLLAAGRADGALLATMEARRRLEEIADDGSGPGAEELRRRTAELRKRCDAAAWDASVGRLLIETAEDALAAESPSPDAVRRARALVLDVLPRYFELTEEAR